MVTQNRVLATGSRAVPIPALEDETKSRPKLEPDPPADGVVRRIFQLAQKGRSALDITKTLNAEGIPSPSGKCWLKTSIHRILTSEAYTGTLV